MQKEHGGYAFEPPRIENYIGARKGFRKSGEYDIRKTRGSTATIEIEGLFL